MDWYNMQDPTQRVPFLEAVRLGSGRGGGLFQPMALPQPDIPAAGAPLSFPDRCVLILEQLLDGEIPSAEIHRLAMKTFTFPVPLVPLNSRVAALELFHGPTLSFKDFGARFLARVLTGPGRPSAGQKSWTILTATSGDTGAAIAHAFHGLPATRVVVLYPQGRVAPLQERMFATLGGNVHSLAIQGDFDDCQRLVRSCLADAGLTAACGLNSGNSINAARLLAQILYYFEAAARWGGGGPLVFAVPCGNFGNLTAGLLAWRMGLPVKAFIAVTNVNDTVPRYLKTGRWRVRPTRPTLTNAMDVSSPNNWPRAKALLSGRRDLLRAVRIDEAGTVAAIRELAGRGYLADPHSALAFAGLQAKLLPGERGVFLSTAHPAKYADALESILGCSIPLPPTLVQAASQPLCSMVMSPDEIQLRRFLLGDRQPTLCNDSTKMIIPNSEVGFTAGTQRV